MGDLNLLKRKLSISFKMTFFLYKSPMYCRENLLVFFVLHNIQGGCPEISTVDSVTIYKKILFGVLKVYNILVIFEKNRHVKASRVIQI